MAGIYIHIPFCRKACTYCDFHFSTRLEHKPQLVQAICKELAMQKNYLNGDLVESIYFGGGTPSVLSAHELSDIFEAIYANFELNDKPEITLEANPDDLNDQQLEVLAASPVNRLSVGIQSFDQEDLRFMNRSHNAEQARTCVEKARDHGYDSISIDLIYGVPGRDEDHWHRQLEEALKLQVPHISAYALTVEKETLLHHLIKKGAVAPVDEAAAHAQFNIMREELGHAGYEHYEVSNFAKPGKRASHNTSYWTGEKYLGVGPSAHSFNGDSRQWNVANNHLYMSAIEAEEFHCEKEILSVADRFNETVMTSLRREEGVDLEQIDTQFGAEFGRYLRAEAQPLLEREQLLERDNHLVIAPRHRFFSDGIASSLFYI